MQLQPRRQPGRNDRKAASYVAELFRLRAEGYTYEAIREALADVGVELSTSALRREVGRKHPWVNVDRSAAPSRSAGSSSRASVAKPRLVAASGREIAEAFFDAHPSNSLLRAMETS